MPINIPVSSIDDSPFQDRLSYDAAYINELAESIRQSGLLQPPIGRIVEDGKPVEGFDQLALDSTSYITKLLKRGCRVQIAFGHNRLRAMQVLGFETMPIDLRQLTDEEMSAHTWSENARRKDLNALEEARAIERRMDRFGWTQERVAQHLGLNRSTVANKLRLLNLPPEGQTALADGHLSERQAIAILPAFALLESEPEFCAGLSRDAYAYPPHPEAILKEALSGRDSAHLRERVGRLRDGLKRHKEEEERRAEREAAREQGEASGALPRLRDMSYSEYNVLSGGVPPGCSAECPCRMKVLNYVDEEEEICSDPKRFTKLRQAAERERKAKLAKQLNRKRQTILAALGGDTRLEWSKVALVTLVRHAVGGSGKQSLLQAAELLGIDEGVVHIAGYYEKPEEHQRAIAILLELPTERLLQFPIVAMVERELTARLEWGGAPLEVTTALLKHLRVDEPVGDGVATDEPAELEEVEA